jgi:hypothetical protein
LHKKILNETQWLESTSRIAIYSRYIPIGEDFDQGKEGRVMISTSLDDVYYTDFQQEDGVVKISAYLHPIKQQLLSISERLTPIWMTHQPMKMT